MRPGLFTPRNIGLLTLLIGGLGCEDRTRPVFFAPGDGQGPFISIISPSESTTVARNATFALGVRAEDLDGIDSMWTTLEPNVNTLQPVGANGETSATVGYVVLVPAGVVEDTLVVRVRAVDILGDTSDHFIRRLLVN